jgi:hypothetical protein
MQAGQSFFLKIDPHRWVVVSDPAKDPQRVVFMNFTSTTSRRHDPTCVITHQEYPSLGHNSSISYADAKTQLLATLQTLEAKKLLTLSTIVSEMVLSKIRAGATISKRLSGETKDILRAQGLI